jgi:glycosyltransferase involved in cell wall biosynthesis
MDMKNYIKKQMQPVDVPYTKDFKLTFFKKKDLKTIPILINSYNRLECLKRLVERLKSDGYTNIYIIDNNSTYEPLLRYFDEEKLRVFRLSENVGYLAVWKCDIIKYFINKPYVYTDPDVLPDIECPSDFIEIFYQILSLYPKVSKVGFGLRIDDLPDHFAQKQQVIQHESQFWTRPLLESNDIFGAPIDTTFALYRAGQKGGWWLPAIRTGAKYVAQHLPWYTDSANLTEEDIFYKNSVTQSTHWTKLN